VAVPLVIYCVSKTVPFLLNWILPVAAVGVTVAFRVPRYAMPCSQTTDTGLRVVAVAI